LMDHLVKSIAGALQQQSAGGQSAPAAN
jgi:hypothetical protein